LIQQTKFNSAAKPQGTSVNEVKRLFAKVHASFDRNPFNPPSLLAQPDLQTLAAYAWPRRRRLKDSHNRDEERLFTVARGVQVLAFCRWHEDRVKHPTVILWHGIEGSASAVYMLSFANKTFTAGFNVIRVNIRNCGGTEHLTPTLYHGGMSQDLRAVVEELIQQDGLEQIFLLGFSLGGNMVLKLAGEYGDSVPPQLRALCAISPSVDLAASAHLINTRRNWLYHQSFIVKLKRKVRLKHRLFPDLYDVTNARKIRTLFEFDEAYTARANGFADAKDYYHRASSTRVAQEIRVPTLILHAKDDPFIPFGPLNAESFQSNPNVLVIATERGGHVAFVSMKSKDADRFWAENRALEFFEMVLMENAESLIS
jgi:predicted alpha/beta-fold hydrolase